MTSKIYEKVHPNGRLKSRGFKMDGEYHRDDGPAVELWDIQGHLIHRAFWVNGELHRTDGPAWKTWANQGQLKRREFYVNDEYLTGEAFRAWQERQQRQRELRALTFALEHKFRADDPEREFLRHILPAHVAGEAAT